MTAFCVFMEVHLTADDERKAAERGWDLAKQIEQHPDVHKVNVPEVE